MIVAVSEECDVEGADRNECGHSGITPEECTENECCWDDSEPGVPHCFQPKGMLSLPHSLQTIHY